MENGLANGREDGKKGWCRRRVRTATKDDKVSGSIVIDRIGAGNKRNERGANKRGWCWKKGLVIVVRVEGAITGVVTRVADGATEARDAVAVTPVPPHAKEGVGRRITIARVIVGRTTGRGGYTTTVGSGDWRI